MVKGDWNGSVESTVDRAALEVGAGIWWQKLKRCLVEEYCRRADSEKLYPGSLCGMVELAEWAGLGFDVLTKRLESADRTEALSAALAIMVAAYERRALRVETACPGLFVLLSRGGDERLAAAWALLWLSSQRRANGEAQPPYWTPNPAELDTIIETLGNTPKAEYDCKRFLVSILSNVSDSKSAAALIPYLNDDQPKMRRQVVSALGTLRDRQAVLPLMARLDDSDKAVRTGCHRRAG